MEPEALDFLKRVAKSIMVALLWLAINAVAAIKGDNAFIVDRLRLANVLFYVWFCLSLVLLLYLLRKIWKDVGPLE
jgi:hypothetical protein